MEFIIGTGGDAGSNMSSYKKLHLQTSLEIEVIKQINSVQWSISRSFGVSIGEKNPLKECYLGWHAPLSLDLFLSLTWSKNMDQLL